MAENTVFVNNIPCKHDHINNCEAVQRVTAVLKAFSLFINTAEDCLKIGKIVNDNYTIIQLINDYDHIKYDHDIDNNDDKFAQLYTYLNHNINSKCKTKDCQFIKRHYLDRSKLSNQYISNQNDSDDMYTLNEQYIFNLVSKMHVYFIHSYDINRLTINEMSTINQMQRLKHSKTKYEKEMDELIEDKTIEITSQIIHRSDRTKNKLNINRYNKFVEPTYEAKTECLNLKNVSKILSDHNILLDIHNLTTFLKPYKQDKDKLMYDLIEAYYSQNDMQLPITNAILINCLANDSDIRHQIYGLILFNCLSKEQLNNQNFVKLAMEIISKSSLPIDPNEFTQIAINEHINGKIFIKGHSCFRNSIKFAKIFSSITGYNKKYLTHIYRKINKWIAEPIKTKPNPIETVNVNVMIDEKSVDSDDKEEKKMSQSNDNNEENMIYKIGTQYFYWESVKYHKYYVQAQYPNLKSELLNSAVIGSDFNIQNWKALNSECSNDIKTNTVKNIVSNGYWIQLYCIKKSTQLSMQHLTAVKLYTDFTKLCNILCLTLRSDNNIKNICQIANWARLLTECVQCYGTSMKNSKKRYYRGVKNIFIFTMLVTRFNLPTSTTNKFQQAFEFCDDGGLVLELRNYKNEYDVFKFNCSKLSAFDCEAETLFFGGSTVLSVSCIWQPSDKWQSCRKYMIAIDAILRMINGVTICKHKILNSNKDQQMMKQLLNHIFYNFNSHKSMLKLPGYIHKLLKHHLSKELINLDFAEIQCEYIWMHSFFTYEKDNDILLNISNICQLFKHSKQVTFAMPNEYIFSYTECISLIQHIRKISAVNIETNIRFVWPNEMKAVNKSRFDEYKHELHKLQWITQYSTNSIDFICSISSPANTILSQKLIHTTLQSKYNIITENYSNNVAILVPSNRVSRDHKAAVIQMTSSSIKPLIKYHETYDGNKYVFYSKYKINPMIRFVIEIYLQIYTPITLTLPQVVRDLLLFYYAKPLIMNYKYEGKMDFILLCPIRENNWKSIEGKLSQKHRRFNLSLEYGMLHSKTINAQNSNEFQLSETEIYKVLYKNSAHFRFIAHPDALIGIFGSRWIGYSYDDYKAEIYHYSENISYKQQKRLHKYRRNKQKHKLT
eukprot:235983_1